MRGGADTAEEAQQPPTGEALAVLGCGAVGRALASTLARAGRTVVLWSRSPERAEDLALLLLQEDGGADVRAEADLGAALTGIGVAFLAVTDGALAEFAERCAEIAPHPVTGALALHTNGSLGLEVLDPLREAGWLPGKLHPLCALPPGGPPGELAGAWFATAGASEARAALTRVVADLAGRELALSGEDQEARLFHAAAALLSGGVVALVDTATNLARAAGGDPEATAQAMAALLSSTAHNVAATGAGAALTGPLARGATDAVVGHLAALDRADPEAGRLYRLLGRRMLALAAARGALDDARQAELASLLR